MTVNYYRPPQEINISLSQTAKQRLLTVIANTEHAVAMRLAVKTTGCSGYSYDMQAITQPIDGDYEMSIDENHKLYIQASTYHLLQGLHIDYVKQGIQTKFIYENPMQTGQCGCGESFTIDKTT